MYSLVKHKEKQAERRSVPRGITACIVEFSLIFSILGPAEGHRGSEKGSDGAKTSSHNFL